MKTNLKEIREQKGFKQIQLAKEANISVITYQRYESGERVPSVTTAQLIALALNENLYNLFPLPMETSITKKSDNQSD